MDMASVRRQLKSMSMKEKESFKEYAQHLREITTLVEPPLAVRELTSMFTDMLQYPFHENMVGSVSSGFADLVTIVERIKQRLKNGKVPGVVRASNTVKKSCRNFQMKKEGETNAISTGGGRSRRGKP